MQKQGVPRRDVRRPADGPPGVFTGRATSNVRSQLPQAGKELRKRIRDNSIHGPVGPATGPAPTQEPRQPWVESSEGY